MAGGKEWRREVVYVVSEDECSIGDDREADSIDDHGLGGLAMLEWKPPDTQITLECRAAYQGENRDSEAGKSNKGGKRETHVG